MVDSKDDLLGFSDLVWRRTSTRLGGLTDEEYGWEPVPGCWTVRERGDGTHRVDTALPPPAPAPLTTIAWRLAHLSDCYGSDRNGRFLRVELAPPVLDPAGSRPAAAAAALDVLERAHARWRTHLVAVPAKTLAETLGPIAGPFADGTLAGFVVHMLDEFVHHGAELALMRDLYAATVAGAGVTTGEGLVDQAIRSATVFEVLASDEEARNAAVRDHPEAVSYAARAGRWDLVVALASLGFPVDDPGRRTALHLAAGAGELHAVRVLVEHGADTAATDPVFNATPLGWAHYFEQHHVASYLDAG